MADDRISALREQCQSEHSRYNIGTYKERTQHLVLKNYFEPNASLHEVQVGRYIADIYNSDGICEIQTSNFGKLRAKLEVFLADERVTVVYPCAVLKRICWCDTETGDIKDGRYRSYAKARYKLLYELLYISEQFDDPKLTVKLCEVRASEVRLLDGYGADKKKRATKADTLTDDIIKITDISNACDIRSMLPFDSGDILSNADISKALGLKRRNLWMAVKFLTNIGILEIAGKKGNAIQYRMT